MTNRIKAFLNRAKQVGSVRCRRRRIDDNVVMINDLNPDSIDTFFTGLLTTIAVRVIENGTCYGAHLDGDIVGSSCQFIER